MSIDRNWFAPHGEERVRGRHHNILAQLIATAALVMSIAVAATIGIARADGLAAVAGDSSARFAVALVLCFVLVGMGGVSAFIGCPVNERD